MTGRSQRVFNNPELDPNVSLTQPHPVPKDAGNLISLVDRCWVCDSVFPEYGGPPSSIVQEFHHPVPRSFGGSDGPTVSLCSGHHATVHTAALRMKSGVSHYDLVSHEQPFVVQRIEKLSSIIKRAIESFSGDPNRPVPIHLGLPSHQNEKLKLAAKSRGVTANELIRLVLTEFLQKEFPTRRRN
jgi:hypothetical protein